MKRFYAEILNYTDGTGDSDETSIFDVTDESDDIYKCQCLGLKLAIEKLPDAKVFQIRVIDAIKNYDCIITMKITRGYKV